MSHFRNLLLMLLLALLLGALTVLPVSADDDDDDELLFPTSLIAFSSLNRAGSTVAQIWTIDPNDPTQLKQLTNQGENTRAPLWSPDGARIAFTQGRRGDERLFLINVDGSGVRQVSQSHTRITAQFWSLDGERIYITTDPGGGPCGFAWIRADGSPGQPEHPIIGAEQKCIPDVSPDFSMVVFKGRGGAPIEVGDLSPDGETVTNIRTIVSTPFAGAVEFSQPRWSPDGLRIAFVADSGGFRGTIYSVAADGTDPVQVTKFTGFHAHSISPSWSPDGSWLVFQVSNRTTGIFDIYLAPSDGSFSPVINLTNDSIQDEASEWSPELDEDLLEDIFGDDDDDDPDDDD